MAQIVMADGGLAFDGDVAALEGNRAGAEFVALAAALAGRGHRVRALTHGTRKFSQNGCDWAPLGRSLPAEADLFIVNRDTRLLRRLPRRARAVLWVRESGRRFFRWGRLSTLGSRRPVLAFLGVYHAATYPGWLPGGPRAIVPPVTAEPFRTSAAPMRPPPPFAIFTGTSGPGLSWLLDLWSVRIHPALPKAQLYVFAAPGGSGRERITPALLGRVKAMGDAGVHLRVPGAAADRIEELRQSRVLLDPGHPADMFGYPAAEAQAMGVPAVVCDVAALRERVVDGESGFVVPPRDAAAFAAATVRVLGDDALWRAQRDAALRYHRARGWDDVAADFEELRR